MSDQTIELPNDYIFEKEGLYSNIVTKDNSAVIGYAALDYSFDSKYLMFSYDTLRSIPPKIINSKLFYLVIDLKKDSVLGRMNYPLYKKFLDNKRINKDLDLSIRNYPK